jgi:hypothetical protein
MNALSPASDDEPVVKKIEPVVKKKTNTRNLKIALGLATVILIPTIGSTLAESIVINTNSEVEFAQGFVDTAVCDNAINISPKSVVLTSGVFYLHSLVISGVLPACNDKVFAIKIMNNDNPAGFESIGDGTDTCTVTFSATTTTLVGGCTVDGTSASGFTLYPHNGDGEILAEDVNRVTLESTNS